MPDFRTWTYEKEIEQVRKVQDKQQPSNVNLMVPRMKKKLKKQAPML